MIVAVDKKIKFKKEHRRLSPNRRDDEVVEEEDHEEEEEAQLLRSLQITTEHEQFFLNLSDPTKNSNNSTLV